MLHVDDFITEPCMPDDPAAYAKFMLMNMRTTAWMQAIVRKHMNKFKLFCTYGGDRYRVTGASRLGDIWLAKDPKKIMGYDLRVDVAECSEWSSVHAKP